MEVMARYLEDVLTPALQKHGVSDDFIRYTTKTIEAQATSLLRHWDDLSFRKTMLLIGSEEGTFYETPGKNDIKCFVVVAIRNSPLEIIQSDNYREAGLTRYISNEDVKAITGSAIRFFSGTDFAALCRDAKNTAGEDFYPDIIRRYPVAWSALRHLATAASKVVEYEKVPFDVPYQLSGCDLDTDIAEDEEQDEGAEVVFDAYSPEMNPTLLGTLRKIAASADGAFIVDSFKTVTRNFEKLLKILEFLLTHDSVFATANYYLENGHVERRSKLLRAAHTVGEMEQNLSRVFGTGYRHASVLKDRLE